MSDKPDEPMQLTVFGTEVPSSEVPHMNCSNSEDCQAPSDKHKDTCPVEQRLREDLGF